ncbi:MAG: c-type cytochrome biogenesis protein CcmI [Pseudomonadota bacterium]|nr:c-type cytochrome biogenesis protein CcmI [Pseudomonadota bacterium]
MLWLALIVLCSVTVLGVCLPLLRPDQSSFAAAQETAVYQDQLEEVDRDLNSGSINPAEAQAAKSEILRRLESASRDALPARPLSALWRRATLLVVAGLVIVGSVGLYAVLGTPNMPSAITSAQQAQAPASVDVMITQLKARLKQKPDDAEGWRLLGLANFSLQHWPESVFAYGKAVALTPENIETKSALAEAIIQSEQGHVTPRAQQLINEVLEKNPKDLRSIFYDAAGHEQAGDQQGAFERWSNLLANAPETAPWRADISRRVAELTKALGKVVPPAAQPADGGQQAMIEAMVQKQADSLKADPKDLEGWQRLIRSYVVLKSPEKAKAALQSAKQAFDSDQGSLAKLQATADELRIN